MSTSHLPAVLQNLELPVIASPMFIASGPELVKAQCKAGIVGSFPALNARPAEMLDAWLTEIRQDLASFEKANPGAKAGPIAVNQIVHQSNERLQHDVEVCVKHEVPIIISSLRAPPKEMLDAVHGYGGIVLHDVISIRHAYKALEAGVDGLILVAQERAAMPARCRRLRWWARCASSSRGRLPCPARSPLATPFSRRKRWEPISPISAHAGWRPGSRISTKPIATRSSNHQRPTSSIPTCLPACTATI